MALTINTKVYNKDVASGNSAKYVGPGHSVASGNVDIISLGRQTPKPTKDFAGVARVDVRLTRTVSTGVDKKANIVLGGGSDHFPVGASVADMDAALSDYAALRGLTEIKSFAKSQVFPA